MIFAYAGNANFFSVILEMKEPQEYPKALYLLQLADAHHIAQAACSIAYRCPDRYRYRPSHSAGQ